MRRTQQSVGHGAPGRGPANMMSSGNCGSPVGVGVGRGHSQAKKLKGQCLCKPPKKRNEVFSRAHSVHLRVGRRRPMQPFSERHLLWSWRESTPPRGSLSSSPPTVAPSQCVVIGGLPLGLPSQTGSTLRAETNLIGL